MDYRAVVLFQYTCSASLTHIYDDTAELVQPGLLYQAVYRHICFLDGAHCHTLPPVQIPGPQVHFLQAETALNMSKLP